MKKIDYMKSSLDFCLYPDEIVQRFAGREVIVYATDYESYGFFQLFAGYLKIKNVINHFDDYDFLTSKNIRDLDELLLIRNDEPIFVLSRRFWVEIVTYLESKGLVLGSDLFFWEQGVPMNELVSDFIAHNQRLWKSEAIVSKNKILVPFPRNHHDAGRSVCYAYCGNYLAKRYNAKIFGYICWSGTGHDLMYTSKSAREVARSHNVVGLLDFECDQRQLALAKKLFDQIWSSINTWQDVKNIDINGMNFGISIIRAYLRYCVPSLSPRSESFAQYLWVIIQHIVFLLGYFQTHIDIKAVILLDGVCRDSFLRDIAIANNLTVYAIGYPGPGIKCNTPVYSPTGERFYHYKEFFLKLSPKEQVVGIEWARRSLEARLNGDNKEITYMTTSIYEMKPGERVLEQNDKLKVLICPHTLEDDLSPYGWQIFANFIDWMGHLGELSNSTDYDWYLKMHPVSKERDHAFIKDFLAHYPRIKIIPTWTSPKQLKAEGIKFAFTMHGTLGHEYPALGIQVVNASNNPHIAFNFCYNPTTAKEFDDIVFNFPRLIDKKIDMQEMYQFYCIHFLYYRGQDRPRQEVFFKRPELYSPPSTATKAELFERYKTYLEDWTPDFHEITKQKVVELFREMDNFKEDVFYKNPPEVIQKKLETVGLHLD